MRIAPKPQPGQEVSLTDLLAEPKNLGSSSSPLAQAKPPCKASIVHAGPYWRLSPISLRGGYYTYDFLDGPLDDATQRNFSDWVTYAKKAYENKDFVPASADVLFSILDFLDENLADPENGEQAKSIWEFIQFMLCGVPEQKRPIMLTQCNFTLPSQEVVHDYGLPTEHHIQGTLTGCVGEVYKLPDKDEFTRLTFGCQKADRVNELFLALTGKEPFAARTSGVTEPFVRNLHLVYSEMKYFVIDAFNNHEELQFPALGVIQLQKL